MKQLKFLLGIAVIACSPVSASVIFFDGFTGSPSPSWGSDRYDPETFTTVSFGGSDWLSIGTDPSDSAANRPGAYSSTFYNTQGKTAQTPTVGVDWQSQIELYVTPEMLSNTGPVFQTTFWSRTGPIGSETGADYFIVGLRRLDLNDPFNPNAANISTYLSVWDSNVGWTNTAVPGFVTTGWNTLGFSATASGVQSLWNGNVLLNDTVVNSPQDLTDISVKLNNTGQAAQSFLFDNAMVSVPEPSAALLGALGVLGILKRRRC